MGMKQRLVLIVQDCRDVVSATGRHGIYEGDFPRRIQYRMTGKSQWETVRYAESIITDMKECGLVETTYFTQQAAEQLGLTLPMYGTGSDVAESMSKLWELSEKLRDESETGFYFVSSNPRILLEDGTHIWGDECWWKPVDEKLHGQKLTELLERSNQQVQRFCELLVAVAEAAKVEAQGDVGLK